MPMQHVMALATIGISIRQPLGDQEATVADATNIEQGDKGSLIGSGEGPIRGQGFAHRQR
jgi:hypothetical protein